MEPFIGQLALFGFNFAPRGWAFCQGQLLPISGNEALFSLLGTMYGGDGQRNFALPDLQGRVPVGFGRGPGLPDHPLGKKFGHESVTLELDQMPTHSHAVSATSQAGDQQSPIGNVMADEGNAQYKLYSNSPNGHMRATDMAGGGQPISVQPPSLGLNWCIALQGIFPPRS